MRFCVKPSHCQQAEDFSSLATSAAERAFAPMGVLVVLGLLMILVVSGFSAILSMKMKSNRLAEDTAAMAAVEAKVEDTRAVTCDPPNCPFGSATLEDNNEIATACHE